MHASVHPSVTFRKSYAQHTPFPLLRHWPALPLHNAPPNPCASCPLTCHHACDGRRGIAALSAGGDVGWVSRQCGPHHLSPWKNTARSHQWGQRKPLDLLSCFLEGERAFPPARLPLSQAHSPPLCCTAHRLHQEGVWLSQSCTLPCSPVIFFT